MTPSDVLRVREARRRLREVTADSGRDDSAIRVIELQSPRAGGAPLNLHPDFAVLSNLSRMGHDQVLATINALHQATPTVGLAGTVVVAGELFALHDPKIPSLETRFDVQFADVQLDVRWVEVDELEELVAATERAVMLTSAELRGADATAAELRIQELDVPDVIDLRTTEADREEIRQTLEALDRLEPNENAMGELSDRLDRLIARPSITALAATVEQYSAALERVQPTDADHVRDNLERALDEAVEAHNEEERARRQETFAMVDVLSKLGVNATPDDAVPVAQRILAERSELRSIRTRLLERLATPTIRTPTAPRSPELENIERKTAELRHKLRNQRLILTSARMLLAATTGDETSRSTINEVVGPISDHGRALPILFDEPLDDLPSQLGSAVLSVLLRLSEQHQIICISDDADVHVWARDMGGRVGWTTATGWFAGQPEPS